MPIPRRSSGDIPRYGSYPSPSPEELAGIPPGSQLPEHASISRVRRMSDTEMNATAERIGNAIGSAVDTVRNLPRRMQRVPQRIQAIRDRITGEVKHKSGEFAEDARESFEQFKSNAQMRVRQARERSARFANERPFAVIASVAAIAFIAGVSLRLWRSYSD
jgi:ElaB/YqjD/DUF883 family membrane-anchored ribosome-binding protein